MTSRLYLRPAMSCVGCLALMVCLQAAAFAQAERTSDLGDRLEKLWLPTDNKWVSYGQGDTRAGNRSVNSGGQLMTPIWQNETSLFFGDFRGRANDYSAIEGNFGAGYRQLTSANWIIGASAFYDIRRSNYGNTFQQATLGIEAMSLEWDARMNGYIPDGNAHTMASGVGVGPSTLVLTGNQLALSYSGAYIERSYHGFDGEVGYLLASSQTGNAELRGFVGGYNFGTTDSRFPEMVGPRARLEGRLYDLTWLLGEGSRLVAGFEYQYDRIRDSQYTGLVQVRIPLGRSNRTLTRLERRMLDTVIRDVDIVSQADLVNTNQATLEQLQIQSPLDGRWEQVGPVAQANGSSNLSQVVNQLGSTSTVFVDGSGGPVNVTSPIVMHDNQRMFGGGELLQLRGAITHQELDYVVPGVQPTLIAANPGTNVIVVGNNDRISGINIVGGDSAISSATAPTLTGFFSVDRLVIQNTTIDGANTGIGVGDLSNSLIEYVAASNNTNVGFLTGGLTNTAIWNNLASHQAVGFSTNGTVSEDSVVVGNVATENALQGYKFAGDFNGVFVGNVAHNNGGGGYDFVNATVTSTGVVAGNLAMSNYGSGFQFSTVAGQVSNNAAFQNGYDANFTPNIVAGNGFEISNLTGTFFNNYAIENSLSGVWVDTISSTGVFDYNLAAANLGDGVLGVTMDGQFTNNFASDNGYSGIGFVGTVSGLVSGNESIYNQTRGFYLDTLTSTAVVRDNYSEGNERGFEFVSNNGGLVTCNIAIDNDVGMLWLSPLTGTVSDNVARGNYYEGFNLAAGISSTGNFIGNKAIDNGGDGVYAAYVDGTLFDNRAIGNGAEGFNLFYVSPTGVVAGNVAKYNAQNGFYGFAMDGQFTDNIARENDWSGISFIGSVVGLVENNVSTDNLGHGFYLNSLSATAVVRNNISNYNTTGFTGVGFNGLTENAGLVTGNSANHNVTAGFWFSEELTGVFSNNTATFNGADGFSLSNGIGITGLFSGNSSSDNDGQGYAIGPNSGIATGNTGSGNVGGVDQYP